MEEVKKQNVDVKSMSKEERNALLAQLQQEEKNDRIARRETYEALRAEFMHDVKNKVTELVSDVKGFRDWLETEAEAFTSVMREYGQVKSDDQRSYTITDGDFRLEVKSNKVKGFDERADMAADRLIDYLKRYMQNSEKGSDDPMYQMAMTLLERNKWVIWIISPFPSYMSWKISSMKSTQISCAYSKRPTWYSEMQPTIISQDAIRTTVFGRELSRVFVVCKISC